MNIKKVTLLFFLLAYFSISQAQEEEYAIRHFTTDEGLLHNAVTRVFHDSRQFIWVGTRYGLNRFDGNEFKVFTKKKNGLEHSFVKDIMEDQQGKLWIKFDGQLITIFDTKTEQAAPFDKKFPNAPFQSKDIQILKADDDNKIWLITNDGSLYTYVQDFIFMGKNKDLAQVKVLNIINPNELYAFLDNKKEVIKMNSKGEIQNRVSADLVDGIGKITDDVFWVSVNSYGPPKPMLQAFNWNGERSTEYLKYESEVHQNIIRKFLLKDAKGNLQFWHYEENELCVTDEKGETHTNYYNVIQNEIGKFIIDYMYLDQAQNIWVGTTSGLVLMSPKKNLFKTLLSSKNNNIYNSSARGIEELDDENLFVSTYDGFFKVNKKTKNATKLEVTWESVIGVPTQAYGVGTLTIGDSILCGNHSPNYFIFNINSLDYENVVIGSINIHFNFFFKDRLGQLWIGTNSGLFNLDLKNKTIQRPPLLELGGKLSKGNIHYFFENGDELLVSTDLGFFAINHQGKILNEFKELGNYQINFLHKKNDDQYWLTTKGNGIIIWNRKTNELQKITKEEGLTDNYIYSIHEDEFGFFWLPSNNGLMRLNPKDFTVNTFNESDGIADSEFNSYSYLITEDGQMYFGGVNGVTTFHPKDFQSLESQDISFQVIGAKKLKEDSTAFSNFEMGDEIYFDPTDKAVALDFCLFDYYNSFQSKYAYQIEGYEDNWNYLNRNKLVINRIPYGNYNLKVKAQGRNGIWANQVLNIPLYVLKPFYLRWPFIVLGLLLLAALIYLIIKWRINNLRKINTVLENTVAKRTKELANLNQVKDQFFAIIAHDLRGHVISFKNTSKKVEYLKRKGQEDEIENYLRLIDDSADNLSNLLDNLLNWALVEKGIFPYHPEVINLKDIVEENIALFQPLSQIKEVDLQNKTPTNLNLFADKDAVLTILRNLINNAIKYSDSGDEITIQAFREKDRTLIHIKDTGIGISTTKLKNIFDLNHKNNKHGTKGEKGSGFGLSLCKRLIELNKGNIQVKSKQGKGTIVMVEFPSIPLKENV